LICFSQKESGKFQFVGKNKIIAHVMAWADLVPTMVYQNHFGNMFQFHAFVFRRSGVELSSELLNLVIMKKGSTSEAANLRQKAEEPLVSINQK
jgi:hypothetical protein